MKKNYIITASLLLAAVLLILFYFYFTESQKPENIIRSYLDDKYKEDFGDSLVHVKSMSLAEYSAMLDDGGLITGDSGSTIEYFTAYSKNKDLEFEVYFLSKSKEIFDSFEAREGFREGVLSFLTESGNRLSDSAFTISVDEQGQGEFLEVDGTNGVMKSVSRISEGDYEFKLTSIGISSLVLEYSINQDSLSFCREKASVLRELNTYLNATNASMQGGNILFAILTSDEKWIFFDGSGLDIAIYDINATDGAYGIPLDDYILNKNE